MKRFPLQIAITAVALAVVAALLHPLALVLSLAPFDTRGFVLFLQETRSVIADLFGWGFLALVLGMAAYVAWARLLVKAPHSALENSFSRPADILPISGQAPGIAVAITAYNDAEATAQAVRDYSRIPNVVKVLVIDNNSTDRTAELAEAAGATVIRETRQGYGFACMRGLTEGLRVPGADVIVLTEGDGTFVADDTKKFLAYIGNADLVVGNRVVRGMVARDSQMDHFFTWGNMGVAMLLRLRFWDGLFLGPAGLSDVGCTFRAIRKRALERILPDLEVGGMHFSPHMLLVALAHGLSVVEIPIRFRSRVGESKGASRSFFKGLQIGAVMIWHILAFNPKSIGRKPGVVVERGVIIRHVQNGSMDAKVEFVPGAMDSLVMLSRHGHRVVVVGDSVEYKRAGISRKLARAIDGRIAAEVEHRGGRVEAFMVCPHQPGSKCSCWYPRPQLLIEAARRSPFDLDGSVVVSNRHKFLSAAAGLGCKTIYVGNDPPTVVSEAGSGSHAVDLARAVEQVIEIDSGSAAANGALEPRAVL